MRRMPVEEVADRLQRRAVRLIEQAKQVIVDLPAVGDRLAKAQQVVVRRICG